jgi:hypothetical protein
MNRPFNYGAVIPQMELNIGHSIDFKTLRGEKLTGIIIGLNIDRRTDSAMYRILCNINNNNKYFNKIYNSPYIIISPDVSEEGRLYAIKYRAKDPNSYITSGDKVLDRLTAEYNKLTAKITELHYQRVKLQQAIKVLKGETEESGESEGEA